MLKEEKDTQKLSRDASQEGLLLTCKLLLSNWEQEGEK